MLYVYISVILTCITETSESEGEDGYHLSTQFDEVPADEDKDADANVNIDQEIALERHLMRHEVTPESEGDKSKSKSDVSKFSIEDWQPRVSSFKTMMCTYMYVLYSRLRPKAKSTAPCISLYLQVKGKSGILCLC